MPCYCRRNILGVAGWRVLTDALEHIASITSLNDCDQIVTISAGGMAEIHLDDELVFWAALFLERSASTLTKLYLRHVSCACAFEMGGGGYAEAAQSTISRGRSKGHCAFDINYISRVCTYFL
jgi:hypothetical protein